jgi:hypothetical protein
MPKVTMLLTERDAENAENIQVVTQARSKAHALSIALSLTRFVINKLLGGAELVVREHDGHLERIVMPELENIRHREQRTAHSVGS